MSCRERRRRDVPVDAWLAACVRHAGTLGGVAAGLLWIGVALDVGVLAGLFVRGRWRQAYLLPVLVAAALTSALTVGLCRACNTWAFWLANEFAHVALLLLLGLEVCLRAFAPGSRGRRSTGRWALFVVLVTGPFVLTTPAGIDVLPLLIGAVLLFYAGLWLVVLRYGAQRLALHDAVVYGFLAYLFVYAATWGFTGESTALANFASPLAFNLAMLNLLRVAWAREERAPRRSKLVQALRQRLRWS